MSTERDINNKHNKQVSMFGDKFSGENAKLSRVSGMWLGIWWGGGSRVGDCFKWGSQGRPDGESDI